MKYINPDDQRYQYQVVNTLNGCSIEVLVMTNGCLAAVTKSVAETLGINLPEDFRHAFPNGKRDEAEKELERLAAANGWVEIRNT